MGGLVLLVEDEADLADAVEFQLERAGHRVRRAATGPDALLEARRDPMPDLVLLDLMLPGLSGKDVCRQLRSDPRTKRMPILMATAMDSEVDRIVGFELGADDYLAKPYSVRELVLRVEALLRRSGTSESEEEPVTAGRIRIDPAAHRVWVDGESVSLTATEFRLLNTLVRRRGRVQSRDVLLRDVWGYSADVTTRTVDTHVKRLRQRLGDTATYIETLRGVGYRFSDEVEFHAG
jgi:two-component system phosphate regulon response regulator PhoB